MNQNLRSKILWGLFILWTILSLFAIFYDAIKENRKKNNPDSVKKIDKTLSCHFDSGFCVLVG